MSDGRPTTRKIEPSSNFPSTYNDLLRATFRPRRTAPEWNRCIELPPPASALWELKDGNLDITYLRGLPEFEHWNTYNGPDFISRDLDILNWRRMTLLDLFRRGPVSPSWYDEMDRTEREDRVEGSETGPGKRVERVERGPDNTEGIAQSRRIEKDVCSCRDCAVPSRAVRAPTRVRDADTLSPRSRERQPTRRSGYKSPSVTDTELYRRQYTPEPGPSRPASAISRAEDPLRRGGQIHLSNSPSFILTAPTLEEFLGSRNVASALLDLYWDTKELERFAKSYRDSYERLWAERVGDGPGRSDAWRRQYKEIRDELQSGY